MTPYQLKRSILTAAIQGKITKQDENEGTGAELLAANAVEKKRRIADEKVKTGKPCRPITEDDTLFDIPSNWSWARFGDLVLNFDSRRRPVTKEDRKTTKGLYDYYGATGAIDRVDEYIFDGEFLMIGEDGGNFFVDRDNSFIANGQFWANNHVHVVQPVKCEIWYLKHCLDAYNMPNMGLINGIAVPKLNQENLNSIMIPVPPLAEQKRIVEKIEELLPLIDRYEQAWSRLEDFNKRFPVDMQKSILQMAIQGKLVEQRAEEGTGEELFRQIQEEKQRSIKAGTIKKEKPLPEIADEEIPFDIPESWKWIKLGDVASVLGGKRIPAGRTLTTDNTGYKYIRVSDMKNGSVLTDNLLYVPTDIYPSISRYVIHKEDVYITVAGTIGRVGKILPEIDGANLTENADRLVFQIIDQDWLIKCLESSLVQQQIIDATTKVGQPKLAIKRIQELLIPLPPLAEQKRIVAKLEEILPLCERLK